uniref:CysteinetRNA ligase isoform X1 n=1 Tax=Rhizophora mucronata TaxID=61149 RepID=A0A2P2LL28_RHIMU
MQHSSEQSRFHGGEIQGPFHHHVCQKKSQDKQHSWHCIQYAIQVFQDPMDCPKKVRPSLLPSIMQNQRDFSFLSPQQLAHQIYYLLISDQITFHIPRICLQRSRHPHQCYRHIHSQESA